jgi:hypothetical protein
MIRVICPNCGAKLNAKEKLIGQTRNCLNCGNPFEITAAESPAETEAAPVQQPEANDEATAKPGQQWLPTRRWLDRLDRHYHYLICDRTKLIATWQHNGDGWMIKSGNSMLPAARNRGKLLAHGDFRLVELKLKSHENSRSLVGIMVYRLVEHYALQNIEMGDDHICAKIAGTGNLSRDQKILVRNVMKEQFMFEVWKDATEVMEFLANNDFRSPGVG